MNIFVYILLCADGSYYVGITRGGLEKRVAARQSGAFGGYTSSRLPVKLVFWREFQHITEAISAERQIKGWRREKKKALIEGEYALLSILASRAARSPARSFETRSCGALLRMRGISCCIKIASRSAEPPFGEIFDRNKGGGPRPEKAAKRPSRRTHKAAPVLRIGY